MRTKPRNRHNSPPGKAEEFWAYKSGDPEAAWNRRVVGDSLLALEAKLDAIDAEHAKEWPNALDCSQQKALLSGGLGV